MPKLVLPRVQAMLLCDGVAESALEDGVYELHGVRTEIQAPSFPYVLRRLYVFLQMSGHVGEASLRVEVDHPDADDAVYKTTRQLIEFRDPMFVIPFAFVLRNCRFPAPGVYYVQVYYENKIIGERSLLLSEEV